MRNAVILIAVSCLMLSGLFLSGCAPSTQVTRVDPETQIDLSGFWNDTDSRMVAQALITDSLARPWYGNFREANGKKPTVIVGRVVNETSEHISAVTFIADMERAYVNSGSVRVVATAAEREELRDERVDQGKYSSPETIKQFGREQGADYMMQGNINSFVDSNGGEEVRTYKVTLTLIDIETNEKVWIGDHEIKKYIGRSKFSG